jgi:RNA polymerase sigma-70 factor (ECF subfamily)
VDDAELIRAVRAGRAEAAGQWVRQTWDGVYSYVYRLVRDVHLAEDITQETFLRALRALHRLDLSRPLGPWLLRVATNLAIDERRRNRPLDPHTVPAPDAAEVKEPADDEVRRALGDALAELPPERRSALLLRVHQQWPYGEIAAALRCPEATARWYVHQAKTVLRQKLERFL